MSHVEAGAQLLDAAADLIEGGHWTKWTYFRDEEGRPLYTGDPDAVAFSMLGAVVRCNDDRYYGEAYHVAYASLTKTVQEVTDDKKMALSRYNDKVAKNEADVVEALRVTARILRSK